MELLVRKTATGHCELSAGSLVMRCAIGRTGMTTLKAEGDGGTPVGTWPLRRVFYRQDRVSCPVTGLPTTIISPDDGWCDAPADPNYNRPVKLPYPASAEEMWRQDNVYDIVVELGYNDDPVIDGRGSAIFLHLARANYEPTAGCVAVALDDMRALLALLKPGAVIRIDPEIY